MIFLIVIEGILLSLFSPGSVITQQNPLDNLVVLKGEPRFKIRAGVQTPINLKFQILQGYHIQTNENLDESIIPTSVDFDPLDKISFGQPVFPDAKPFHLKNMDEPLWVFDEVLVVKVPLSIPKDMKQGTYETKAEIYYQACDSSRCLFPRKLEFKIYVLVQQ